MPDLSTRYLGLELRNPIIVGASSLTLNAKGVRKCAEAGAGAVVLKSLFEEQIRVTNAPLDASLQDEVNWHGEVFAYMEADIGMRYGSNEYLQVIRECKRAVDIPVIASINCVSAEWWDDFAADVEAAGADALELNIAIMPQDPGTTSEEIEEEYVKITRAAREAVQLPIAVKLGPYFTSLPEVTARLRVAGADGFVLFNRFYRPTIDIEALVLKVDNPYSNPDELSTALRWISLLSDRIAGDYAGATGVHDGRGLVRLLLAGARSVQVASVLYQKGIEHIQVLLRELTEWMERKEYGQIEDFRGIMSQAKLPEEKLFGRVQYIKGLVGIE